MSKLLTIFGATGQQGGSIIKTFQSTPSLATAWNLRAVTRDVNSAASITLKDSGVQVVSADFTKPETLEDALQGSYAAFVTTLSIPGDDQNQVEIKQGKSIVDACLASNVKHLVWSGVPSPKEISQGKLSNVHIFEAKNQVMKYIESIKGDKMIASYFEPASYFQNLERSLKPDDHGNRHINMPFGNGDKSRLPHFDTANDTGVYVAALLSSEEEKINGYRAQAVTQWLTGNEIAKTLTEVTKKPFDYVEVTSDKAVSFMPAFMQLEYKEMFEFTRDYHYYGIDSQDKQEESDNFLGITSKSSLANWAKGNKAVQAIV